MHKAAIYLRSSKDRSDVSIDAQRRELKELAKAKDLSVIEEFEDAVESGKDENRPGFQQLLMKIKSPQRRWDHLLALDTSRIARNQYLAHALHYECEKRGIKILYSKIPETGGVVDVMIRSVMQAFDQLHSLMSKEKGLAGMAENVKQGFRAGGRAPMGYLLKHFDTGAIRDGEAVKKSKLIPDPDKASLMRDYLQQRARGISRARAQSESGLKDLKATTLVGVEWNALTYAGHTVWNVQNEKLSSGGYKSGTKRKARTEWVMQNDTHEALITTEEAESVLLQLENSPHGKGARVRDSGFVLTGLMKNSKGDRWYGCDGIYYRINHGKRIPKDQLEKAIIGQIMSDLASKEFIQELTENTRRANPEPKRENLNLLTSQAADLQKQIERLGLILIQENSPPKFLVNQMKTLEEKLEETTEEIEQLKQENNAVCALSNITEADVEKIIQGLVKNTDLLDQGALKEFLRSVIDYILLDQRLLSDQEPVLTCELHYRINTGNNLASPRGSKPIAGNTITGQRSFETPLQRH